MGGFTGTVTEVRRSVQTHWTYQQPKSSDPPGHATAVVPMDAATRRRRPTGRSLTKSDPLDAAAAEVTSGIRLGAAATAHTLSFSFASSCD
ncbi:hypothetical protein TNIN_331521 [Trichonephila inaurata madagascariensis]|uniref:Uncharacterized protein n=1 Tax=Trichonephila inaurata madagascariensis TaxID=2747483 RepID=A0A8X6IX32_9ARAC|nr:hypothetical protein TNIN_331521 [Trichonephila inaurata madagascariensis]